MENDDDVRSSCFASLDVLRATHGDDIPYRDGLDRGFPYRGARVPFLSPQKGIFRAAAQRGPAALSINTSFKSPYEDAELEKGFRYAYRAGSVDQPDNAALRSAFLLRTPLVYFVATQPGRYKALYPIFIEEDDPVQRFVIAAPGHMVGPVDEQEPLPIEDEIERKYAVRETRVRLHQARFRGRVLDSRVANQQSAMGSASAQFITEPSTRIWSASRPIMRSTSLDVCWTTKMGRCSIC